MILIDAPRWPAHGTVFAHLVSDTAYEELHDFAERHGVPRRAFDGDHYDIPKARHAALVSVGATVVSWSEMTSRLNRSGLRLRKRRGDKGLVRYRGRALGDGLEADIDLVATDRPVNDHEAGAAATVVRDADGAFLVVRSVRRGTWDCPGGRREPAESVVDCAVREVREESGVQLRPGDLRRVGYERIIVRDIDHWTWGRPYVQVFDAQLPAVRPTLIPEADDVDAALWITPREFRDLCGELFWWPLAEHLFVR
ncbi:MAG: DUF4031 domain-containing protein [Dermatophilaceae bacterium]